MFRDNPKPVTFCKTTLKTHEESVKPHLAYSVKEADELVRQGKPISSQSVAGMYFDGEKGEPTLSFDQMRGIDINDAWNYEQSKSRSQRRFGAKLVNGTNSAQKGGV